MTIEITFRTLKGTVFKLSADDTETVLDLKRKVAAHQNAEEFAAYRLIHKGKILQDDATVSTSNITSSGFVVVMPPKKVIAKPKKATPSVSAASAPEASQTPAVTASKSTPEPSTPLTSDSKTEDTTPKSEDKMDQSPSTDAKPTPSTTIPTSASGASSSDAASALVTGSAYEDSIKRICEMGFPEEQVKKAMRAAFNNPDRAVEFLFSGIPDIPEVTAPPDNSGAPVAATTGSQPEPSSNTTAEQIAAQGTPFDMFASPNSTAPGSRIGTADRGAAARAADSGRSGNLDFLRDLPLFGQIRRLVQTNPAALPQILQHLSTLHPDLIPLIEANQEEFSRLINEPLREGEGISDEAMEQLAQAFAAGGGMSGNEAGAGGGGGMGGPTQVYVTPEERDQINRLNELAQSIGLAQGQVLETWLACNRDETLTANFLFDHAEELRADRAEEQPPNNESDNNDRNQQGDPDATPDRPPS